MTHLQKEGLPASPSFHSIPSISAILSSSTARFKSSDVKSSPVTLAPILRAVIVHRHQKQSYQDLYLLIGTRCADIGGINVAILG